MICRFILPTSLTLCSLFSVALNSPAFAEDDSEFDQRVKPFLKQHCLECHTGDSAEGNLKLVGVDRDFSRDETARTWQQVLQALRFDEMPPAEETRPDSIAKSHVIAWIEAQQAKSGRAESYYQKLLKPDYGNYVNHELLYSGTIKTPPFSPSRLWRFSPEIFKSKHIRGAQSPFSYVTRESGVRDYSATSGVDQSTIEMILINTDQLLDLRTQGGDFKRFEVGKPAQTSKQLEEFVTNEFRRAIGRLPTEEEKKKYMTFLNKNVADGGLMEGMKTTIKAMYLCSESIYRMELGLGAKLKDGRRLLSADELSYAVSYALTDFGPERNTIIREAIQKKKLDSASDVAVVVQRILDDGMNPKKTPRITRFFEEFFGFNQAGKVFKDMSRVRDEDIKQWNTNRLMYEAEQLVEYFINRDKDVIKELLTSNRFYVAHPGNNQIAKKFYDAVTKPDYAERIVSDRLEQFKRQKRDPNRTQEKEELARIRRDAEARMKVVSQAKQDGLTPFPGWGYSRVDGVDIRGQGDLIYLGVYNLPPTHRTQRQQWDWPMVQPFELPKNQRAGILTHPAWLAAHSLNDGNDPIRRGHWIQEKLLAGVVQDVPPDVDANVGNDPHKTLRERMETVRAKRCWRCHRKMNPLGEPFEIFDDWGRHRTHIYFDKQGEIVRKRGNQFDKWLKEGVVTARPINATGEIRGSGDSKVDGKVTDALELIHRLGGSTRARQSFIRYLFRYFMGRNEMLSDSKTLIDAEQAYLKSGGSFKTLVVSLLSSDSFMYRRD
jgi:hypothetical protein